MKADPTGVQTVASAILDTDVSDMATNSEAMDGSKALRTYISNANLLVASMGLVASYAAQGGMSGSQADVFRHHLLRLLNLNSAVAEDLFFPVIADEDESFPDANAPFTETKQ